MQERRIILITTILNFIVAVTKLIGGILFSFSTLIADSVQSFVDFFTDIASLFAVKIGNRRANKRYPFGYGQVHSVVNLITGVLMLLIGVFIIYQMVYFKSEIIIKPSLFLLLFLMIFLKGISVYLLRHFGKAYASEIMVESSKETFADLMSTMMVFLISIIAIFEDYLPDFINVDKIGCFIMAIYVFYSAISMIILNINSLLYNAVEDDSIKEEIIHVLKNYEQVDLGSLKIVKMAIYYHIYLSIQVYEQMQMSEYLKISEEIKRKIKRVDKSIKYIDIEPVHSLKEKI